MSKGTAKCFRWFVVEERVYYTSEVFIYGTTHKGVSRWKRGRKEQHDRIHRRTIQRSRRTMHHLRKVHSKVTPTQGVGVDFYHSSDVTAPSQKILTKNTKMCDEYAQTICATFLGKEISDKEREQILAESNQRLVLELNKKFRPCSCQYSCSGTIRILKCNECVKFHAFLKEIN